AQGGRGSHALVGPLGQARRRLDGASRARGLLTSRRRRPRSGFLTWAGAGVHLAVVARRCNMKLGGFGGPCAPWTPKKPMVGRVSTAFRGGGTPWQGRDPFYGVLERLTGTARRFTTLRKLTAGTYS